LALLAAKESFKMTVSTIRIEISETDFRHKLKQDPNWSSLSIDYLLEITDSLYLIDLEVSDIGAVEPFLNEISQNNELDQAPFAEKYFDSSGLAKLVYENEFDTFPSEELKDRGHVRCYMHYFDPLLKLEFGEKSLPLPAATPMPNWLQDAMPYTPPN
jgi:hypothetical protein